MVSIDDLQEVAHGLFKKPIIGSLQSQMAEIRHLENRHDFIFFCRGWSDLDKILQTGTEWHVDCGDVWKWKPDVEFQYDWLLSNWTVLIPTLWTRLFEPFCNYFETVPQLCNLNINLLFGTLSKALVHYVQKNYVYIFSKIDTTSYFVQKFQQFG